MVEDCFNDKNEKIFRAVRPKALYWSSNGTITDAVFDLRVNETGVSFFRGNGRSDYETCRDMRERNFEGEIISLTVQNCSEIQKIILKYTPSQNNIYHSEITYETNNEIELEQIKHRLALNAVVEQQ